MNNVSPKRNFYNFKVNNKNFVMGSGSFGLVRKVSFNDIKQLLTGEQYMNIKKEENKQKIIYKNITNKNIENIATNNNNNKNPSKYPFVMKIFRRNKNDKKIINEIFKVIEIRNYIYNSIENKYNKKSYDTIFIFPLFKPIKLNLNIWGHIKPRLVTFYRNGGDTLEEYISKNLTKKFNYNNIELVFLHRVISKSIVGLKTLHSLDITHRDIKPENMVVNEKNVAFIDFDLAIILKDLNKKQLTKKFGSYSTPFFDFYTLINEFKEFKESKLFIFSKSKLKISNFLEKYLQELNENLKKETLIDLFNITQENDFDLLNYYNNVIKKKIKSKKVTKEDYFFMDRFALGLTLFIFIIKIYVTFEKSLLPNELQQNKREINFIENNNANELKQNKREINFIENNKKLSQIKNEIRNVSPYILELFKPPI